MKAHCIFSLGEPDFINESGVKWWLVIDSQDECQHIKGWLTETQDGKKDYIIVDHAESKVLHISKSFEKSATAFDLIIFAER